MTLPLYNQKGERIKSITLPENIFGQKPNPKLVSLATRVYLANKKTKLASTKLRSEVAGGGRKPHRQKGTGRARAGSIRAPGRRGGGVVFGPKPVESSLKLTKKMRQKALVVVISDKLREESITVVDKFNFKEPKTKKASEALQKLARGKRTSLLVLEEKDPAIVKSFRNLKEAEIALAIDLNPLNVLRSSGLIFTLGALEILKNRFGATRDKGN
ncbi:MAG: 50S ribosomal protein L4 [Candidatus Woykebacteria bacterium RBG_16_43_9]|uniref:Large ribosomal subunit protein uL4 n=1 Tax=Candidatus Woykebacteria bacterium RBG_16_43_9 TaxID=1802596 RepID=A0A1G1WGG6_9BACT|nr:MAG: 50S ribosomal protein L4 [Candidatus Woykebacteria bacterium RBG_16_43_9]